MSTIWGADDPRESWNLPSRWEVRLVTAVTGWWERVRDGSCPGPDVQVWDTKQERFTAVDAPEESGTSWRAGGLFLAGMLGGMWLAAAIGFWLTGVPG